MNGQQIRWAALACMAMLGACGEDSKREEPIPVRESVFGEQVEAMDRAKQQASEMEDRMQDLNSQLDTAEGNSDREASGKDDSGN